MNGILRFASLASVVAVAISLHGCATNCGAEYFENMICIQPGAYDVLPIADLPSAVAMNLPSNATETFAVPRAEQVAIELDRKLGSVTLTCPLDGNKHVDVYVPE